jgi:hypothetical protein
MPAQKGDLLIYQGDDYAATVLVSHDGIPPDQVLLNYTAKAQIRNGFADDFSTVIVEIQTLVQTPYVNLSIPKAQTLNLMGDYLWDLQVIDSSGVVTTILYGNATVLQEVTR